MRAAIRNPTCRVVTNTGDRTKPMAAWTISRRAAHWMIVRVDDNSSICRRCSGTGGVTTSLTNECCFLLIVGRVVYRESSCVEWLGER